MTVAQIMLTVFLVVIAVGGYHYFVAEDTPADPGEGVSLVDLDLGDLEARLGAVEGQSPILVGQPATGLADRLRALEKRLAVLETAGITEAAPGADSREDRPTGTVPWEPVELDDGGVSPLSAAQEKRIRDLMSNAMRDRRRGMEAGFMDRALERLGIELTDDQKSKFQTAMGEHRTKLRELRDSSRESGLTREETLEKTQELTRQLTEQISTFIPAADAEAITAGLSAMGGRRGPGGRGPIGGR